MNDVETSADAVEADERFNFVGSIAVALLVGAGLCWAAKTGSLQLLIAIAAVQALVGFALVLGLRLPGTRGALLIAAGAAAAADVVVSVWPHGRLGAQVAVLGLAVPAMFIHQLGRGASRHRIVESLGSVVLVVFTVVSLPALLQLRHEFLVPKTGGNVVFGVVLAAAGGLVAGYLMDMVVSVPRFDRDVPRGLLGLVATIGFGAFAGHLALRTSADFAAGRGAFAGAAVAGLAGLFAIAVAFIEVEVPLAEEGFARRVRPVLGVLVPLCLLAPIAFVLCLAIRR